MTSITLCTYTYNDASLVHELLHSARAWTRLPDAVVVVDDGSRQPFEFAESAASESSAGSENGAVDERATPERRVIRIEQNSGPTTAKSTGISAAQSDLILSMDCDIRLTQGWLESAIPLALRPDVGIVGCAFTHDAGDGVVGRYLRHFDTVSAKPGDVDFITGGIWLFRRDVWQATNGFNGYAVRTHQDHHFCKLVKERGLRLVIHGEPGYQVRRISRQVLVRRFARWLGESVSQGVDSLKMLEVRSMLTANDSVQRIDYALRHSEPLFIYLEMLLFARLGSLGVQNLRKATPAEGDFAIRSLVQQFRSLCAPYPKLSSLLQEDFAALDIGSPDSDTSASSGVPSGVLSGTSPDASSISADASTSSVDEPLNPWAGGMETFGALERAGLFRQLEAMTPLLREEEGERTHFSFYSEL